MARRRYANMDNTRTIKSFKELYQWKKEAVRKNKDYSYNLSRALNIDPHYLQQNRTSTTITWIGHATFLIQIAGLNILTDPVWAKRMVLKKRLVPPGLAIEDLPYIDVVLISHAHYDHLHFQSLRYLKGNPLHLVPIGLQIKFKRKGFHRVAEFAWWEQINIGDVQFTFVPSQHWTRRSFRDTNTSHWGGWVMRRSHAEQVKNDLSPEQERQQDDDTIYFAGDSGYFCGFKQIGERFNIDCCLMPIGAYEPEWFMCDSHLAPEEAIQAFLDTRSHTFIPMHYGTFPLADDTPKEALDRLKKEWKKRQLDQSCLKILKIGESFIR